MIKGLELLCYDERLRAGTVQFPGLGGILLMS